MALSRPRSLVLSANLAAGGAWGLVAGVAVLTSVGGGSGGGGFFLALFRVLVLVVVYGLLGAVTLAAAMVGVGGLLVTVPLAVRWVRDGARGGAEAASLVHTVSAVAAAAYLVGSYLG